MLHPRSLTTDASERRAAVGYQPFVQALTPPCRLHAPRRLVACEYKPSLHCAIAPAGLLSSAAPDAVAAGAELARERLEARAVATGAGAGAGAGVFELAEADPAMPPWREHAPRPALPVVPSAQLTVALAAAADFLAARALSLAAVFAAFVAAASTPPCPAQAPRPDAADDVPSLQMEAAACAEAAEANAATEASTAIPRTSRAIDEGIR